MFAEGKHAVNTDAISSAFLEITRVTVSKQCGVPSTSLWGALHNAATAGGGKANLSSYPTKVVDMYNDPRSFPATSMVLAVPITGSEVPDCVYLCVSDQCNISTKRCSPAYLG